MANRILLAERLLVESGLTLDDEISIDELLATVMLLEDGRAAQRIKQLLALVVLSGANLEQIAHRGSFAREIAEARLSYAHVQARKAA